MIFPSNRILPEGCSIIYKTYTSESDFYEIPKFTINFNDNINDGNYTMMIKSYKFPAINEFPNCPGKIEWMVSNINIKNVDGETIIPYEFDKKERNCAYFYNTLFIRQNRLINKLDIETINKNHINFLKLYKSFCFDKFKILDSLIIENNNNSIQIFRKSDMLDENNTLKNPGKNIINKSSKKLSELIT